MSKYLDNQSGLGYSSPYIYSFSIIVNSSYPPSEASEQPCTTLSVNIRLAQIKDLKELVEVLTESFHGGAYLIAWLYPLIKLGISEDLRSRIQMRNPHYRCFVATVSQDYQQKIVGTVEISVRHRLLLGSTTPYIANLAVSPSYRRQGIARLLLLKCEETAREWGFRELSLHVLEDNMAAQELYFHYGYTLDKVENSLSSWIFNQPRQFFLKKRLL